MIVIIGGGIIGLSIAWRLAAAGRTVTVIERGEAGRGATWAAAGMLPPHAEVEPQEDALLPLLLESRRRWPAFAAELGAATDADLDYRTDGALIVALDRDDAEGLRFRMQLMSDLGLPVEWLGGRAARRLEPHLARGVTAAIHSPDDHHVDHRAVARALIVAVRQAGGTLREHTTVVGLEHAGGRVAGVWVAPTREGPRVEEDRARELLPAEAVVLAAGAWSAGLAGLPEDVRPPVRPVKGQMLALQMVPAAPLIQRMVWAPDCYIVPRSDGRLLLGASVEEQGFDTTLTAGAIFDLLRGAWEALPGIYDLPLIETWAGLRPTSRDDAPILGECTLPGLIMATGHHRNGILLTPITADLVAGLILRGEWPDLARPFGMARFAAG
jgi:glycine oxidase